ncbi:MAG TPA: hypothetical protein EYP25_12680 [Anaerolineae bacterium]|nr:hypothetical protein [Caldilineae bacterium]HID35394.1 hypothetical protein [Anaerolineae bacterium]HIQ12693.1 hypothetical protein [Caldilineales bacterium]
MTDTPIDTQLIEEAKTIYARLQTLWADEGVDQLSIFLDPEITDVLEEIKRLSMAFIAKVAQLES